MLSSGIREPVLMGTFTQRNERCNVCRIFPGARICSYLHAPPVQFAAFQPALLTLYQSVLGLLGDTIKPKRWRIAVRNYSNPARNCSSSPSHPRQISGCSTVWGSAYLDVRHSERLPIPPSRSVPGVVSIGSRCDVLPRCRGQRLFLAHPKDGEAFFSASRRKFGSHVHYQSEHKIQSGKGTLNIEMDQVPKILKPLVDEWTPEGFIVSFKVSPSQIVFMSN